MGHMEEGILPREGMDGSDHIGFILAHCAEGIEISFLYTFSFLSFFLFKAVLCSFQDS